MVVNIRDFGARGDGSRDDTDAFRAMHRRLLSAQQANPECWLSIRLPRGTYRYRWNRWLWGLRRAEVLGEGASLQCISNSAWAIDQFVLATNADPLRIGGINEPMEASRPNYGFRIHTAEPGSRAVTLVNPADASHLMPGRYACVLSFDQQFYGYPPNCRYFEYAVVETVSGASVRLDRSLKYRHSETNPEDPGVAESIGRARIIPIDSPRQPLALSRTISGIRVLPNPNVGDRRGNALLGTGTYELRLVACDLLSLTVNEGHRCEVVDSEIEFTEPDKLLTELEFRNCRIGLITQATGIEHLRLEGCRVGRRSDIQSRYVRIRGCTFSGTIPGDPAAAGLNLDGISPTRLLEVRDSVFVGTGGDQELATGVNPIVGIRITHPITVGDGAVRIPLSDERSRVLLQNLEPGDAILVGDVQDGTTFSDGRAGIVETIDADGPMVVIRTSAPVRNGDTLFSYRVRRIVFEGNRYVGMKESMTPSLDTTWEGSIEHSRAYRRLLTSADFARDILICPGTIRRISAEVLRPYDGAATGAYFILEAKTPALGTVFCTVDLRRSGQRWTSAAGVGGNATFDLWQPIPPHTVVWDLYMRHSDNPEGADQKLAGAPDRQARYLLSIDTVPFWPAVSGPESDSPI
jgi:hypothetical protein